MSVPPQQVSLGSSEAQRQVEEKPEQLVAVANQLGGQNGVFAGQNLNNNLLGVSSGLLGGTSALQQPAVGHQQQQPQPHGFQQPQQHPQGFLQPLPASLFVTHNLIPRHLQASALAASLHGTPGHQPALISPFLASSIEDSIRQPALTVQDRPMTPPVYNGVNPNYPGLRVLHNSPPIFAVDNFLTQYECDFLVHVAQDSFGPAPVVGKGAGEVSPSRTSSTCYLAREDLPDLLRKVSMLTGKPVEHCELPQVGRYFPTQQYLQHYDAFDLATEDGRRFAANGGQRTITVLIYLNDVMRGGQTRFPALNLDVQPRRGTALIFFPATIDGMLDKMALHAAMPAIDTKYVSQVWIRQSNYNGQPSKRLSQTLGLPFSQPLGATNLSQNGLYPHNEQQQQQQPQHQSTTLQNQ